MKTFDIGRFYTGPPVRFQTLLGHRLPLLGVLPSVEVEPPYRRGKAIFLRIPFTPFGFIAGWWGQPEGEVDDLLSSALSLRELSEIHDNDFQHLSEQDRQAVRIMVADYADGDLDSEWEIIDMIGLSDVP